MEKKWMDEALDLATEALEAGEVPVGCVFVYNGEVIARGRNTVNETRNTTRHAELNCLDQTAEWCMANDQSLATVMADIKVNFWPCMWHWVPVFVITSDISHVRITTTIICKYPMHCDTDYGLFINRAPRKNILNGLWMGRQNKKPLPCLNFSLMSGVSSSRAV
jgi:hypothetical protein